MKEKTTSGIKYETEKITMTPYKRRKWRSTAIGLAVFFGAFSWLYTYRFNAFKFWISVAFCWTIIIPIVMGFYAIIDAIMAPEEMFENYFD